MNVRKTIAFSARSWVLSHFVPFEMEIDRGDTEVATMRSAFWTSLRYANQAGGSASPSSLQGNEPRFWPNPAQRLAGISR